MNNIKLVGVGNQGAKTIHAIDLIPDCSLGRIYVNVENSRLFQDGIYMKVPFTYELGSWYPDYPVKHWLSKVENKKLLNKHFHDAKIAVFAAGLGGETNLIVKHFLMYLQRAFPNLIIWFVGTVPFREETEFICNDICKDMMRFFRENTVLYTIIENTHLKQFSENDYRKAYDNSYKYLVQIAEGGLSVFSGYLGKDKWNLKEFLGTGLLFYDEFIFNMRYKADCKTSESILTYAADKTKGALIIFYYNQSEKVYYSRLAKIYEWLEQEFGKIVECIYMDDTLLKADMVRIKVIAKGLETSESYIHTREIQFW